MAGHGSDQRALQYEQTLVSPTGPATGHGSCHRPDSIKKKKKVSTRGKSMRVHAVRARRIDRRVYVALADSAGGCASANKRVPPHLRAQVEPRFRPAGAASQWALKELQNTFDS